MKSGVRVFRSLLLASICVAMLPSGSLASGEGQEQNPYDDAAQVSHPQSPLRGTGILILDPRDSRDVVKERIHKFFSEVGAEISRDLRQAEIKRQVDALLAADSEAVPQISLVFRQATTRDIFHGLLLEADSARESEEVCPITCPFRDLYKDGVHIHLTKPVGGPGDTVIALEIDGPSSSRQKTLDDRLAEALQLRESWLERYPELRNKRKPIARMFGVQIFAGDPLAAEESLQQPHRIK